MKPALWLVLTCSGVCFLLVGVGCLCAWAVIRSFQSGVAEIIPIRDPRIRESINHHE